MFLVGSPTNPLANFWRLQISICCRKKQKRHDRKILMSWLRGARFCLRQREGEGYGVKSKPIGEMPKRTGPKTEPGKARSSLNALRHGLSRPRQMIASKCLDFWRGLSSFLAGNVIGDSGLRAPGSWI